MATKRCLLLLALFTCCSAARREPGWPLPLSAAMPRAQRIRIRLREKLRQVEASLGSLVTPQMRSQLEAPITVAIMSGHYFGSGYARDVDDCKLGDIPLACSFIPPSDRPLTTYLTDIGAAADAVWYHAPTMCTLRVGPWIARNDSDPRNDTSFSSFKARPEQVAIVASMESSAYYPCLDDGDWMSNFDLEMTYRQSAHVQIGYWHNGYKDTWEREALLPPAEKKDAVVYIQSNCNPASGRHGIVEALARQPGVTVDSLGRCLNQGTALPRGASEKHDAMRRYRYCIAMENSIAVDYVSEKVYDALAAGCLPIYLGAPNIEDFVPTPDAIIDYSKLGSPEALAAELLRLSADDAAYEARFAWRAKPETWGAHFREMVHAAGTEAHPQCRVCQVIARRRIGLPEPATGKPFQLRPPLPVNNTIVRLQSRLLDIRHESDPNTTLEVTPAVVFDSVTQQWAGGIRSTAS